VIRTVNGDISREQLGVTLVHEHLLNRAGDLVNDGDANLDDANVLAGELRDAVSAGLQSLVEVSTIEMRRDLAGAMRLASDAKINLIISTGYFCGDYVPAEVREAGVDRIVETFLRDLRGENASRICAGIIGEIGISAAGFTPWERRIHEAAALAHRETGCPIITHTFDGAMAVEQAKALIDFGVRPSAILICHIDANRPIDDHLAVLETGAFVSLDRVGDGRRCDDESRANRVVELIARGHGARILLSHDLARQSRLKVNGGHGYAHLLTSFLPRLRRLGLASLEIDQLTIDNPASFLDWNGGEAR
jgi:phosphotriesterase-related protein